LSGTVGECINLSPEKGKETTPGISHGNLIQGIDYTEYRNNKKLKRSL
jgi:hypothetical protein